MTPGITAFGIGFHAQHLYTSYVIYDNCRTNRQKSLTKRAWMRMASDSERVTIRIPTERLGILNGMVKEGKYGTISDVIRAAIDSFIDNQLTPEYIKKLTVELPKGNVVKLEELVQSGDSVSIEDAIRNAVREYIRRKVTKAIEEYKEK